MKKSLLAAVLAPLVLTTFFSCQTTGGAALKADDVSLVEVQAEEKKPESDKDLAQSEPESLEEKQEESLTEDLQENLEEKIPESEIAEHLSSAKEEEQKESGAVLEQAAEPSAEQKTEQDLEQKVAQGDNNSLVEKIKGSNANANTVNTNAAKESADRKAEKAVAKEESKGGAKDESLTRLTNQGKEISGGPLIGPGSDTSAGDKTESNEAISLSAPQDEQKEQKEKEPDPVPSRSMTIKNNQFLDIVYPGSGWIYLGEEGAGDHFIFQGRKLGNGQTTFTLRSKKPGAALLHFYKNDILTGSYIDDYLEISITDKSAADATHVEAPSYAEVVPPKFDRTKAVEEKSASQPQKEQEAKKEVASQQGEARKETPAAKEEKTASPAENSPSEKVQTVIQTSGQEKSESKQKTAVAAAGSPSAEEESKEGSLIPDSSSGTDKSKSLLERAQKAYDEKRYAEALDLVQQFFDTTSEDFDAGLYLEGLILEAKSEVRNIKSAIGAYDTLIKNWPQSNYWRKANERSIYLKRFYIDIR